MGVDAGATASGDTHLFKGSEVFADGLSFTAYVLCLQG